MSSAIMHRGPDDSGTWVDEGAGVALGHQRLSILDLSAAGHQPMVSHCGRFVLIFNGEIYNHPVLRVELDQCSRSINWKGHSDTETLLMGFCIWGIERTLIKAKGMFALALWDRLEHKLTLARDRMGEKPLYYGFQNNTFLFGSELKSLKAHPAFVGEVDRDALALLVRHNCIPGPYSIYKNFYKLPPGTYAQLPARNPCLEEFKIQTYWSLSEASHRASIDTPSITDSVAIETLNNLLNDATREQMCADVPLGALLSGGVDSSLVVALMQANSTHPVNTFTIGFDDHAFDESEQARMVASHLGTNHTELNVSGEDALDLLHLLPSLYDEPFADSSQIPTYLVMKMTRQHVKVALSGDGGDELFGGYDRYRVGPRQWRKVQWMPFIVRRVLGSAMTKLPEGKLCRLGRRLEVARDFDDWSISMIKSWSETGNLVIKEPNPTTLLTERGRWPEISDPVARMMALDALTYLPDDILVKVDRAAMAVSLETRAPLLDKDVVEYALNMPLHLKIRDGKGKWALRQVLSRYVPDSLVDRPKKGFSIPLDNWLRGPLRQWAEELISEQRLRDEGFFNPQPIRQAWQQHLSGKANNAHRLWSILMFQAWLECQ